MPHAGRPCQGRPRCAGKAIPSHHGHRLCLCRSAVLRCVLRRKGKEAERLRGDIVMEGRDYSGRRSSRAAVFGAGEEEEEEAAEEGGSEEEAGGDAGEGSDEGAGGSGSGSEEGDEEGGWLNGNAAAGSGGSSEEEGEDEEPEEAVAGTGGIARRRAARAGGPPAGGGGDSDQDGAGGSSSDEEGQQRSGAAAAVAAAAGDEMAELQREYEQMQQVRAFCLPVLPAMTQAGSAVPSQLHPLGYRAPCPNNFAVCLPALPCLPQDEQSALEGLKERAAKERRKAVAVQAQKSVWQRGLEARILLQRALAGANRLPQGGMQAAAAGASGELATAFAGLAADAAALLGDLLQLMGALGEQNPAVGEAAAAAAEGGGTKVGAKRRRNGAQQQQEEEVGQCGELWEQLDAAYASFVPFRDASIDRWHRKTLLTTGAAPLPLPPPLIGCTCQLDALTVTVHLLNALARHLAPPDSWTFKQLSADALPPCRQRHAARRAAQGAEPGAQHPGGAAHAGEARKEVVGGPCCLSVCCTGGERPGRALPGVGYDVGVPTGSLCSSPLAPLQLQDPSKVLQRTRLPRAAQQQPHQRLLCPDPELQAAKLRRVAEDGGVAQETDQVRRAGAWGGGGCRGRLGLGGGCRVFHPQSRNLENLQLAQAWAAALCAGLAAAVLGAYGLLGRLALALRGISTAEMDRKASRWVACGPSTFRSPN